MIYHVAVFNCSNGDAVYREGPTRDWCANQVSWAGGTQLRKPDYVVRVRAGNDRIDPRVGKRCNQLHHVMTEGRVSNISVLKAHAPHHVELVKLPRCQTLSMQERVILALDKFGGNMTPRTISKCIDKMMNEQERHAVFLSPAAINAAISGMSTRARVRKWVTGGKDKPWGSWKDRTWGLTIEGEKAVAALKRLSRCNR